MAELNWEESTPKKREVFYKVVRRVGADLYSCWLGIGGIKYPPNEWVSTRDWLTKQGADLLVFDYFDQALCFFLNEQHWSYEVPFQLEIWECSCEGVRIAPDDLYVPIPMNSNTDEIAEIRSVPYKPQTWPDGTLMAKRVKLLRRIENEHMDVSD